MKNIKIGRSNKPINRLSNLNVGNSSKLFLLTTEYSDNDVEREKELHRLYNNIRGEWFAPTSNLVDYINNISQYYVDVNTNSENCKDYRITLYNKMKM